MIKYIIIVVVGIILLIGTIYLYNKMIRLRDIVHKRWSEVVVVLKKKYEVIPELIEVMQKYELDEPKAFKKLNNAMNATKKASTSIEAMEAEEKVVNALEKFKTLYKKYPKLIKDEDFIDIQSELALIEKDIKQVRYNYNESVVNYQNTIEIFPGNVVAFLFGFKNEMLFEIALEELLKAVIRF